MKSTLLPLDLQLFSEAEPAAEPPTDPKPPTFDDLLKDKAHQAEFDRRLSKALETARTKWAEESEARIAEAKTEAEKLAKMTLEQKAAHEREKQEKALADREAALTLRELKAEAAATLAEKELPMELLAAVNLTNAEACKASIEAVEAAFRAAVQTGVEGRLKSTTPKAGQPSDSMAAIRAAAGLKD